MSDALRVIEARWQTHQEALSDLRREVFIVEQNVPESLEWDEHDAPARHWIGLDDADRPMACARLQADGKIGRMAVLKAYRGQGIGMAVLKTVLQAADQHFQQTYLYAQTTAIPFYERAGFKAIGAEFDEAGIAHRRMVRIIER